MLKCLMTALHIFISQAFRHTYEELLDCLDEMENRGMKGLVVDVRQNPGGMLNTAIEISDLFVEKGKTYSNMKEKEKA